MAILTETIVDVLDRHTAIQQFLGKKDPPWISTREGVSALHRDIRDRGFVDLTKFMKSPDIRRLLPGYANHRYWHRVLASRYFDGYAAQAWQQLLPVLAEPAFRVALPANTSRTWRASPVPRALVYPFGWSAWLSVRITGAHSLEDLASLVSGMFDTNPLRIEGTQRDLDIRGLFDRISAAVRRDLFWNRELADVDPQDILVVTTVLAKHGGSPSTDALTQSKTRSLLKLVRPSGPELSSTSGHVFRPDPKNPLEYIVFDDHGYFIWNERLLVPQERNRQHLRCYHNNTVRSLAHARQLEGLLQVGLATRRRSAPLSDLLRSARDQLETPSYRNAGLREFVGSKRVTQLLQKATALK